MKDVITFMSQMMWSDVEASCVVAKVNAIWVLAPHNGTFLPVT